MSDNDEYEVQPTKKTKGPSTGAKIAGGVAVAALVGVIGYPVVFPKKEASLGTSTSVEFQKGGKDNSFARIQPGQPEEPKPNFDFGSVDKALAKQQADAKKREEALKAQVAALEAKLKGIAAGASGDQKAIADQIAQAVSAANAENAKIIAQGQKATQDQIAALQQQNAHLAAQLQSQQAQAADAELKKLQAQQAENAKKAEQQRLAALRAEQQAQLKAQIQSPSIVYDAKGKASGGPGGGTGGGASGPTGGGASDPGATLAGAFGQPPSPSQRNEAFLAAGAKPVETTQASVIANPGNTVTQGTIISATLDNAVNSSLPGAVVATVNVPVYSFDGSKVVIPSGSRVFGSYSSDVSIGQARILVKWTRIVTPQGESVELSAFGTDAQGRAGVTGHVNTRFGARFGGAALISLIGATPAVLANAYANDSKTAADTAQNVGSSFSNASQGVLKDYATLPPIISVEQGSQVSIIVDRDLEFF